MITKDSRHMRPEILRDHEMTAARFGNWRVGCEDQAQMLFKNTGERSK
jgi:hypothetical protein